MLIAANQSYSEIEPALLETDQPQAAAGQVLLEVDQDFEIDPAFIPTEPAYTETRLAACADNNGE